jgi:hypothetical protein
MGSTASTRFAEAIPREGAKRTGSRQTLLFGICRGDIQPTVLGVCETALEPTCGDA